MFRKSAFIVDDEKLAIQELNWMLQDFDGIEVIGSASNAYEAVRLINLNQPDILFLDIQIPEMDGFAIVESLNYSPEIIFTTAYDEYAVKAFEVNSVDYLMKPIGQEKLAKALSKLSDKKGDRKNWLFVKDADSMKFIHIQHIEWMESIGNYLKIYHNGRYDMIYKSLTAMESRFVKEGFYRANRREMFNMAKMKSAVKSGSSWTITLESDKEIILSQRQALKFIYNHKKQQ